MERRIIIEMKLSTAALFGLSSLLYASGAVANGGGSTADGYITINVTPPIDGQAAFTLSLKEKEINGLSSLFFQQKTLLGAYEFNPRENVQSASFSGGPADANEIDCWLLTTKISPKSDDLRLGAYNAAQVGSVAIGRESSTVRAKWVYGISCVASYSKTLRILQ